MSDIIIVRKHSLGMYKVRVAAERVAADLHTEFALVYAWRERNLLEFERPGVTAELRLARREVVLLVRLGLFYLPFRGALEREIHEYFDREFAA
jgi:putative polyhydroxyalkanoate system protein